jgi:hypothetical protein
MLANIEPMVTADAGQYRANGDRKSPEQKDGLVQCPDRRLELFASKRPEIAIQTPTDDPGKCYCDQKAAPKQDLTDSLIFH